MCVCVCACVCACVCGGRGGGVQSKVQQLTDPRQRIVSVCPLYFMIGCASSRSYTRMRRSIQAMSIRLLMLSTYNLSPLSPETIYKDETAEAKHRVNMCHRRRGQVSPSKRQHAQIFPYSTFSCCSCRRSSHRSSRNTAPPLHPCPTGGSWRHHSL